VPRSFRSLGGEDTLIHIVVMYIEPVADSPGVFSGE